jgi:hypothetical protein
MVESWHCDLWSWPSDLWPWNCLALGLYLLSKCRFLIGIRDDVLGDKDVLHGRIVVTVTFDLGAVTLNLYFPLLNEWRFFIGYLQGWCIRGQRCVTWWNCGTVTFTLIQWPLTLKFPSALYLLNECRFWIGICRDDVLLGDKGVSFGIVALWPLTLAQWPLSLKSTSKLSLEQMQISDWCLQGTKVCPMVESWWCDLQPRRSDDESEIPFCSSYISWTNEDFGLVFAGMCHIVVELCWCDFAWKNTVLQTFSFALHTCR